jgi:hypothetical protein
MNPIEWLKAIYETFGTPYPRASLAVVTVLGAIFFAAVWQFAANQVEKSHAPSASQPTQLQTSGSASTQGDQSPANTGNGNNVQYEQPSSPKKSKPHQ